ncbi:MAG: glycosyltransferase family 87 protein [Elusimicrobiota bacterium]|jgi:hypothetical protein
MMKVRVIDSFLERHPRVHLSLKAAVWGAFAAGLYHAVVHPYVTQWDFKLYLSCAKTLGLGFNPYDEGQIVKACGYQWGMPCLYPPLMLQVYRPFLWLSPGFEQYGSQYLWSFLKLLAAAGLVALWRKRFVEIRHELFTLLFFLLAYGSPLVVDIRAGNVAVFEQLLLWGGFAFMLSGRDVPFVACILLSALAKQTPAAFLVLLVLRPRPRWGLFLGACVAYAGTLGLNYALFPALTAAYFEKLAATMSIWRGESGLINCSTDAFLRSVLALVSPGRSPEALTLLFTAGVLAVSGWAHFRRLTKGGGERSLEIVFFTCVTYALVVPRLKDYSYLLLLLPTFYILERTDSSRLRWAIFACAFVNSLKSLGLRFGLGEAAVLLSYFKWYALVLVWVAYLRHFARVPRAGGLPAPSSR